MSTSDDAVKNVLHTYLQRTREALVWKLEGLSEREARLPRTPTGTNLLGLVKHAAFIEMGYFGLTFGRPWPDPDEVAWLEASDDDPNADLFASADESISDVVGLYRRVWEFADATITELPLDTPGRVPWWPEGADASLGRILVHVNADLTRHAGHADILREQHDGATGMSRNNINLPAWDSAAWSAHVGRLRALADSFGEQVHPEPVYPRIRQVVLDTTDARALAEFYRELFGLSYREGDERPDPKGDDWLVLRNDDGVPLAFQQVEELPRSTWPDPAVPQQLHLDATVPDAAALNEAHARALELGATLLHDRSDDPQEPLRVYADPQGHPFCIFVG
jgi:catechol 2,3-dioxygenase-like lactoylglutathione lyase family enzyme